MKFSIRIAVMLSALIPLILVKTVLASCVIYPGQTPLLNMSIPLQANNLTVGVDAPNGSIIYQQGFTPTTGRGVNCSSAGPYVDTYQLPTTPYPLSSWNGTPYPGKVYETNVQGIGVAIAGGGTGVFPFTSNGCGTITTGCSTQPRMYVYLIKIGTVSPGSITGSSLPCTLYSLGQAGAMVPLISACFSGVINIVSRTCTTPDVVVPLGSYDVSKFTGLNSVTSWIDSSIKMTNCPVFYGKIVGASWSDSGTTSPGTTTNNTIGVKLTPNTVIVNAPNGIMGIDTSLQGAASGVGIQLASGTASSPVLFNFNAELIQTMLSTQGSTISIPLVARYIQTASQVTPGKADGKLFFTISYY